MKWLIIKKKLFEEFKIEIYWLKEVFNYVT